VEAHLHVPFVKRFERAVEHAQCDRRAPVTVAHELRVKAPVLHHLTVCWHALLIRLAREMLDHMLIYQTYTSTNKLNVRQLLLRYPSKRTLMCRTTWHTSLPTGSLNAVLSISNASSASISSPRDSLVLVCVEAEVEAEVVAAADAVVVLLAVVLLALLLALLLVLLTRRYLLLLER